MRNLLRCRRGTAAFATVVALVPLIGVVALGGEAGSWYVTKQHAQNAADAAAYSGALLLACTAGPSCNDTQTVAYRGKEFAAQSAFCNAGDTTSYPGSKCAALPAGVSQVVQIDRGTWSGAAWTSSATGAFVLATVKQQQPAYLAAVLGFSTINITSQAIAQVQSFPQPPCVLALTGSITFQGSPTVSSPDCGIASNSTAPNAIGFKGNTGISVNALSYTAGDCSQTGGTQCSNVVTYAEPVPDPLSGLNSAMSSLTTSNFSGGKCSSLSAYDTKQCYNAGSTTINGALSGTYFFNGPVKIGGGATITGTATLVLFGNATLTISGNPSIQLTAETSPQAPPALSSVQSLMKDLLIYDPEAYSKQGVNVTGDSSSYFKGIVYVPNSPVTYGGNSSVTTPSCIEVIAYAVTFSGNTNLNNSTCLSDGAVVPQVQSVRLVL